jgi:hypothetical protein
LELLRTAFAHLPQNAISLLNTLFLVEIADALGRDAKAAEGLSIIDEALARSERNEERWCVAELLRIKGELILREGAAAGRGGRRGALLALARLGAPARCPVMGAANSHKPRALTAGSRPFRRGTEPAAVGV